MKRHTDYTQEQMQEGEVVGVSEVTGMIGKVWQGNDGWYGEVADENDYCQGAAFGTTKSEAERLVKEEISMIDQTAHNYTQAW